MLRRLVAGGLFVGLLTSALLAKPGVVTNQQDQTFKGDITQKDGYVYVDSPGGQLKIDARNVKKIDYDVSVDDEYAARHAKLGPTDIKGRMALAEWANSNQRADLAVTALEEARKIDPMNKDAAVALDVAEQQVELDKHKGKPPAATTEPATTAPTIATAPPTTARVAPVDPVAATAMVERRLLNAAEINLIRQREMQTDDAKVRIRFDNGVVKKFVAAANRNQAEFSQMTPEAQALEILAAGDAKVARDVKVMTDPAPLLEYRQKINRLVAVGCASTACHGGTKAGNFALYPGESESAVYTNFYILQTYSATVGGTKYLAMDREVPERSLVLQFGLPLTVGQPAHPAVANFKPRFKTAADPAYKQITDWLGTLRTVQPEYGINVSPMLGDVVLPTTRPAATTTSPTK